MDTQEKYEISISKVNFMMLWDENTYPNNADIKEKYVYDGQYGHVIPLQDNYFNQLLGV